MRLNSNHQHCGFTLVELVILLILMSIVSITVIPRMVGPSAFDAVAARDQIIQTARAAQQLAFGQQNVSFSISASGDDYTLSTNENGIAIDSTIIAGNSLSLTSKTSTSAALSCANTTNDMTISNLIISYDGLGNAISVSNGGPAITVLNGVRMCINNDLKQSACIAPSGFAYAGECDD